MESSRKSLDRHIFYVYYMCMRGRPPKPKTDRRTNHLHILLTEAERRILDKYAKTKGVDLSGWARQTLLAAVAK
jgi:hypothetical protein